MENKQVLEKWRFSETLKKYYPTSRWHLKFRSSGNKKSRRYGFFERNEQIITDHNS